MIFFAMAAALFSALLVARPYKSPVIDGTITGDGSDWDYDDLAVDDPLGDTSWGPNDLDDLWVTYDSLNLYIGVRYQINNNAMIVLIDAGTGSGASDINNLDWYPRNFNFPDTVFASLIIANWNGSALGVHRITNNTTTEDITTLCETANEPKTNFFYEGEVRIPWDAIYQQGQGKVPVGAKIRVVAVIAGGDHWNGPDAAPDNPGMDGNGNPTTLTNFYIMNIDADADSIPDAFRGAIEGTVALEDTTDKTTEPQVILSRENTGKLIETVDLPPGGGNYHIGRLEDGYYTVECKAKGYATLRQTGVRLQGQSTVTGIDFTLTRAGKITGNIAFSDGPGAEASVAAYDRNTGVIAGEGAATVPATGGFFSLPVPEGEYLVVAEAQGYLSDTTFATIVKSDSVYVDTLSLASVKATKLVLINEAGEEIESISTTVSYPDSNIYFYAKATLEARDDADRRDYYDTQGKLSDISINATKLNNITPPRGNAKFYLPDTTMISSISLIDGRGSFLVSDDDVEVLRIHTRSSADSTIHGEFKVGIRSAEPEYLELSSSRDTLTADGTDEIVIYGRLLDISHNPVKISGIPVTFLIDPSSPGNGTFKVPSVETSADGEVSNTLTSEKSGIIKVTASASYLNKELQVIGPGDKNYIEIVSIPGPPTSIRLYAESDLLGIGERQSIKAQLVDKNGNAVKKSGYTLLFSCTPTSAGNLSPATVAMDESGTATTEFTAGNRLNVVQIEATSTPPLDVRGTNFLIDRVMTVRDPAAPEPDMAHNSLAAMDLTTVVVGNDPESINIRVKFATDWEGAHLGIIMETGGDVAGAENEPFGFPITYAQTLHPEFALTYKYSSDDYADLRKWNGSEWLWWDNDGKKYISTSDPSKWVEGINIRDDWIAKDTTYVTYKIPYTVFQGDIPDTVRFEVYLMQETDVKRSAFDSAPHDSTLDLDFDPLDPNADWSITETPVILHNYSAPFVLEKNFPPAPTITEVSAEPSDFEAGSTVLLTAKVNDAGGGIGDITLDLSPINGSRFQPMHDDGTNGDVAAGDSIYSHLYTTDPKISGGEYNLTVTAKDSTNISRSDSTISVTIEEMTTPIRTFVDEENDDHGPDLFGHEGLYYMYPTNSVFVKGAFDLRQVTIYETSKIVAGEIVPSIAFQVKIGNFPNPKDEGTADWNPLYADINIEKVDIYIDAFKGGATEGLPKRQNDFARWDAWDYAIVMEGWYKAVIASNNQNTPQAWASNAHKSDKDIILTSDYNRNTITAIVSKESLGNPSIQDILNWDILVVMTSHDGHSDDTNFGDTRWVNANTSEWNFGGGGDSDRDPNIIDLVTSPGLGKKPGRAQSEMLNYKSPEAVKRLEKGITACVLEATAFEDQGPPVITVEGMENETVPFFPLENAPLYYSVNITDDDQVKEAKLYWRADSVRSDSWMGKINMGYSGENLWNVDLPITDITSLVPLAPGDSTRNIEFTIEASDPSGNTATTPIYTMEIAQPSKYFEVPSIDTMSTIAATAPEGTRISIPKSALPDLPDGYSMNFRLYSENDRNFPLPPEPASTINVVRTIEISASNEVENIYFDKLLEPFEITFHYPSYAIGQIDENLLAVYEFNRVTNTWVLVGGNVNPFGNLVTVDVQKTGTYGLFYDPSFKYNPGEVFSGVVFSPNPFSPNGDGIYDETNISFYLTKEATVTIEIYNIDGYRVKILKKRFAFTAEDTPDKKPRRVTGLVWDGKDNMGHVVPYGIYVARFTVTFSQAAGQRTIRVNKAVAVIK